MVLEDWFDWEKTSTKSKGWVETATSYVNSAYEESTAWVQEKYEEIVEPQTRFDALEDLMKSRRQFLREVPYIYRLNFVLLTTGLVFFASSGVTGRVARAGAVGVLGMVLAVPEASPWKGR